MPIVVYTLICRLKTRHFFTVVLEIEISIVFLISLNSQIHHSCQEQISVSGTFTQFLKYEALSHSSQGLLSAFINRRLFEHKFERLKLSGSDRNR